MAGIDIVSLSRNVVPYVIEQRRYFHCHPEPTSREFKTMKYIQNELDQMKIPYTNIPGWRNSGRDCRKWIWEGYRSTCTFKSRL